MDCTARNSRSRPAGMRPAGRHPARRKSHYCSTHFKHIQGSVARHAAGQPPFAIVATLIAASETSGGTDAKVCAKSGFHHRCAFLCQRVSWCAAPLLSPLAVPTRYERRIGQLQEISETKKIATWNSRCYVGPRHMYAERARNCGRVQPIHRNSVITHEFPTSQSTLSEDA
jgi:hypothetical protein